MPNTTSNTNKNTFGKRRRRRRKRSNLDRKIATVTKQVIAQQDKKELELKLYQRPEVVGATIDNAGVIYNLSSDMSQGVLNNQRIGDQISLKSLLIRLQVQAADAATYNTMRVIIFRWFCTGNPLSSSVLQNSVSTLIRPLSPLSISNSKQLQVLYDNIYQLSNSAAVSIGAITVDKLYIKLRGHGQWQSNTTTPEQGQVYLLAISDSAAVDAPELSFISRLRYTDP